MSRFPLHMMNFNSTYIEKCFLRIKHRRQGSRLLIITIRPSNHVKRTPFCLIWWLEKESIVWTKLWPCRRVSAFAKVASLIPRGDLFNSTWQHHCHLLWPHHNPNSQSSLPYSFKVHLDVIWKGNCHKIEIDMFEFLFSKKNSNKTSSCSSLLTSHTKNERFFMV